MTNKQIIGFTLGCFDMLHIGHINLLKNSKGLCDKLIVGVCSDEYIDSNKRNRYFDINDRIHILQSIKYCDVVVPEDTLDKLTLWEKYKFDYLFVGSDWYGTPQYKQWEKELNNVNCKVIYYPYTKNVSSSQIKNTLIKNEDVLSNSEKKSL